MLRDLKFLHTNSGKSSNPEEAENTPPKSGDFALNQSSSEPPRPPLNAIQEPFRIPRGISDPETGGSRAKHDKTPVKQKLGTQAPLRTPEKEGAMPKDRCNLAKKFDSSVIEVKDEVKAVSTMNTPGSFRFFDRCNSSNSDCPSTQSTPTKSVNKTATPGYSITSGSRPPYSVGSRLPNYAALNKGNMGTGSFCNMVNTVEVPYFELKEDSSFWMDHNVQVLIRIRPLNSMEKSTIGFNRCLKQESSQSVTWIGRPETRFHFDHVACEAIDQETLFRMVGLPMVENCLSGYNSCMFAYGQTGSGKTHTMLGLIDGIEVKPSPNRGMTPRIFEFLFARITAEEESRRDEQLKYSCKCSFLEIYNEQISDLLDPSPTNLMLREDLKKGVYVEDLSEFEVRNVGDILQLLTLGSSNRRVAATNMNKESSRSHSVFTCVIESRWEKGSTTNYRFARLNLVDLAGSERQKFSGAEGERLKEAANINKSLSTLGHVIMALVDIANGKPRHVPYRDSRLTFLLQDSLGGNSKTVIIANVSPSVGSAAETLNTLKFAQRAKLIQNNAIINEDSSGDVKSLKIQIQLLKDELSALKCEKMAQPLSYGTHMENKNDDDCDEMETKEVLRISCKQLKSLETTLSGSLRREQMAEISTKQREAEIEHLNRLVSQREEDTRCAKMMLKFREDKIHRLMSVNGGLMSADDYLIRENQALSEEIQLLRSRIDKNPEVTRFALENIRLLGKVQEFQDFYDEGEREMLMAEISELRNQAIFFLESNSKNQNCSKVSGYVQDENDSLRVELKKTMSELEETRIKLKCCQEENAMIRGEIEEMHQVSNRTPATQGHDCNMGIMTQDSITDVTLLHSTSTSIFEKGRDGAIYGNLLKYEEDIMSLQLELDILKIILQDERSSRSFMEEILKTMSQELQLSNEKVRSSMKECTEVQEVVTNMKLVVEALESQQIELINEVESLKKSNDHYQGLVKEKELEIKSLREQVHCDEMRNVSTRKSSERESVIEKKLKKMHGSFEKEKRFQNDVVFQDYDVVEVEEARKQVEAETAEVIVSLQEELCDLQKEVENSKVREMESRENLEVLKIDIEILKGHLCSRNQENEKLARKLEEKEEQLSVLMEECSSFFSEIESNMHTGNEALKDVSEQVYAIRSSFPNNENCVIQKFGRIKASILEKELLIEELSKCLKEAVERRDDMDFMLRSLRGAVMAIIEAHQQECSEKDREILLLTSELNNKTSAILGLLNSKKNGEYLFDMASSCTQADNKEIVVRTQETIQELVSGLSSLMSCLGQFLIEYGCDPGENIVEMPFSLSLVNQCQISQAAENNKDKSTSDAGSCPFGDDKDVSILTLEQGADYALRMLQSVQSQMSKLSVRKAEITATEKCSQNILGSLADQAILLQNDIVNFGVELEGRVNVMDAKIGKIENLVQQSFSSLSWRQEFLVAEADEAKALATQKISEASSVLKKFEEVQDTMKEADIMINELMIANEALKLTLGELKAKEHEVSFQQSLLLDEIQSLNASNEQKDRQYATLENMYETDLMAIMGMIVELENLVRDAQIALDKELASTSTCLLSMDSQIHQSAEMRDGIFEEIWSAIVMKDCAASVLHLCHVGVMERIAVLNAENSLLRDDFTEAKTMISELQEQNFIVRRELEMSGVAKVNLFADIQQMLSMISSKLGETGEVSLKLATLAFKMQDLQHQEERMSQGHLILGCELDKLMKELESSIKAMDVCILDRERIAHEKDVRLQYQEEAFMINLFAKDIGLLILSTELEQMTFLKKDLENSCLSALNILDTFKKDVVLQGVDATFSSLISVEQEQDNDRLLKDLERKELALQTSFLHVTELNKKIQTLQKDDEVSRMKCLEKENEELQHHLVNSKRDCAALSQELDCRKDEFEVKNNRQRDEISSLEKCITNLETSRVENLRDLNRKCLRSVGLTKNIHEISSKIFNLDHVLEKIQNEIGRAAVFMEQFEYLENLAWQLDSKILSMETNASRKDNVLKGLLFDLSLLQESASNFKDQKDELEKLQASLSTMEEGLELKSLELDQALSRAQTLENQLQEETAERASDHKMISSLTSRNIELLASVKEALDGKDSAQKELMEARVKIEKLEMEISEMETAMAHMCRTTESLQIELDTIVVQRDELDGKFCILSRELELARALAEDKEAVALEAQEIAAIQKLHAEEKETEAKLLERSIQELECTINVLERKVDIIKGEAEQQRLQREELELELLGIKEQMRNVESNNLDVKRCVDEKEKTLQDALRRVQLLEKEITSRDSELSKCKSHISELNLHAEAQASEYKQKFKALEIMVEQLKSEGPTATTHCSTSSSNKLEKSTSKPKGSGSPFKCIGMGLVQQLKSEKDEELSVGRQRIEELETLAASRQKEIFMLKARLATTESMTHDVIRDLLGVKLNMKNYAELMENQKLNPSLEDGKHKVEADAKEQEVISLKQQLNDFVQERNGWLEEIERKQAEVMAAHIALEKLRRQEQLFSTENDILKMENANHKKKVMELESEIKKLSDQQNIQQRIHHHAKIKEENSLLRFQNEELCFKLQRTEAILSRVEKELAQFRTANGRSPYINFDEEQLLDKKLKETEQERMELAQKLLRLCTSVLKAAGIKRPTSEISPSAAEEALEHLQNKFISLELQLEDAKLKGRISNERARLSELRPLASGSVSPRTDCPGQNWMSQTTCISKFDR